MVNEMGELMREAVATAPEESNDLATVLDGGRRAVRRRNRTRYGVGALALAGVVGAGALVATGGDESTNVAAPGSANVPTPDGPVLGLGDAEDAVAGTDYDVLATHTNENLNQANGSHYSGVTDDGLILFKEDPNEAGVGDKFSLVDPETGDATPLPGPDLAGNWSVGNPIELSAERLVFLSRSGQRLTGRPLVYVYDRESGEWSSITWESVPKVEDFRGTMGPDGRLYLSLPHTQGEVPEGGWPEGVDGEAEDAAAEGDTYSLWSVSLEDPNDVRDEGMVVGDVAFTDTAMVWTDRTNGINERIHVRDLATDEESSFDPGSGERCNLLGFGATADRIVLSQYCGTYEDGRDDRVQILTTDGEPVTTLQGNGLEGYLTATDGGSEGLVRVEAWDGNQEGQYVYDLATDRFLRVTDSVGSFGVGGPTPPGYVLWHTAYNQRKGNEETVAAWR